MRKLYIGTAKTINKKFSSLLFFSVVVTLKSWLYIIVVTTFRQIFQILLKNIFNNFDFIYIFLASDNLFHLFVISFDYLYMI